MKGFISIILDPTRFFTDHGVVDLDKGILICRTSSQIEADRIAKALSETERQPLLLTNGRGDE